MSSAHARTFSQFVRMLVVSTAFRADVSMADDGDQSDDEEKDGDDDTPHGDDMAEDGEDDDDAEDMLS